MKTIYEFWADTPIDHILVIGLLVCLLLCVVIWEIWDFFFASEPDEKADGKKEIQYYVDPPRASFRNPAIVILFLVSLGLFALLAFYLVDNFDSFQRIAQ